jgi:hypothetical protein
MDPITAMMIMGGVSAGAGLLGGMSERKAAKKQRAREMRMQMARDLVSAAGGQGLATLAPITQIPDAGVGKAVQGGISSMAPFLAQSTGAQIADKQSQNQYMQQLMRDKMNNSAALQRAMMYDRIPRRRTVDAEDYGFIDFASDPEEMMRTA